MLLVLCCASIMRREEYGLAELLAVTLAEVTLVNGILNEKQEPGKTRLRRFGHVSRSSVRSCEIYTYRYLDRLTTARELTISP
jgi:hypothetical protein